MRLSGKVALVTGSARGIGKTIVERFAAEGAVVALSDVANEAGAAETLAGIVGRGGKGMVAMFDVGDAGQVDAAVQRIVAEQGRIDILVNNAGIQFRQPLDEFPIEEWRRMMSINLDGVFHCAQAILPGMKARGRGKIINICSVMSEIGRPNIVPYTASKGAVRQFTRGLATEVGRFNIQVNGIAPGYFATEMNTALIQDPEFNAWVCRRTPAGRWAQPGELAGAAVFLASAASDYVNGHILYVDGGITASV